MTRAEWIKYGKVAWTVLVYVFAAIGFCLVVGYFAIKFGFTNTSGIIDEQRESFLQGVTPAHTASSSTAAVSLAPEYPTGTPWQETNEWSIMSEAIARDQSVISRAAQATGIPARLIVENLVGEQLRLFFTDREDYKKFFYPLKILGPQTQFSWGVMGMKEATAVQVENNLKDTSSPFYLGPSYEHLLDFPASSSASISDQRFTRMTDQHNHYYSYLYAALFIKEIEAQWTHAGFSIDSNPAVIATLYNIGFEHSTPNANPQVGGAAITINGVTKSFGGLAAEFYNSDLLSQFSK